MLFITSNRIEGESTEQRLLCSQRSEFLVNGDFRLPSRFHGGLQPFQEFYECDAVFQHRLPKTRYLCLIFDGFHGGNGRLPSDDFLGLDGFRQRVTGLVGVDEDIVFKVILQPFLHLVVTIYGDIVFSQISGNHGSQLLRIDEQRDFRGRNQQIAHKQRCAMHV